MYADILPIYAFWTNADCSPDHAFVEHWRSEFPHFTIYGDGDVRPLIQRHFPAWAELYDDIRIPAAKADVARLIMLYEFGGLYVDCHCGFTDADGVRALIGSLLEYDAVFIDRVLRQEWRPPEEHLVINSILLARPRFELFRVLCGQAFANFAYLRAQERAQGLMPYDIWSMSGPRLCTAMLLEPGSFNRDVRAQYEGRIHFVREEVAPVQRNRFRGYSATSPHWSERQKNESLFRDFHTSAEAD